MKVPFAGKINIHEVIGKGGAAIVFRGSPTELFKRDYEDFCETHPGDAAVKVLHSEHPNIIARFSDEAKTLKSMNSKYIVEACHNGKARIPIPNPEAESGEHFERVPYIVMELVQRKNLFLGQKKIPIKDTIV